MRAYLLWNDGCNVPADEEDSFCEKACSIILYLYLSVQIINLHDKTNQTRLILVLCFAKNENVFEPNFFLK